MNRKMALLGICLGQVLIYICVATLYAVPETVLEDSEGISGFELYGKGALWWDGGGTCGEFMHQATIRSRFSDVTVPLLQKWRCAHRLKS
jgi:hypothetical protein